MKHTAGLLLYRKASAGYEVLLVHPGGPFWAKKDKGAWSMPKGEFDPDEQPLAAAKREFAEEIGTPPPNGEYVALEPVKVTSSKLGHAFILEADVDLTNFKSNTFQMEWPPKSGKQETFAETDKAAWVPIGQATEKLVKGQVPLIEQLAARLGADTAEASQVALF